MPITLDFSHADDIVAHLTQLVTPTSDPLFTVKYTGFVAVAGVCVYEMAIKDIFIDFGTRKHPILGAVTRDLFDRINGRVGYQIIKKEYVPRFGEKYEQKFGKAIEVRSAAFLRSHGRDMVNSYNNLIIWRNEFAHAAQVPATATFTEAVKAYEDGKEVIRCLNIALDR
jgi:hypothetical protein